MPSSTEMKIKNITAVIEAAAPLALQEPYDNSGLIVGCPDDETGSALICVDITEEVLDEAEALGADLVISHHPIIFDPLKKLTGADHVQRIVVRAVRSGIALYASHTNLDNVKDGMSYRLADRLGLGSVRVLSPCAEDGSGNGAGVIGELPAALPATEFIRQMKDTLHLKVIRHSDITPAMAKRVALCTGSGGFLIDTAAAAGADIYVTADLRYNDFFRADGRLTVCDIGHFESEYCAIDLLFDIIRKKLTTFALHKSAKSRNPVNYTV